MYVNSDLQMAEKIMRRQKRKSMLVPWLFVLPAIIFTLIFRYYTMAQAFWISLFRYDVANPPGVFVGLNNYVELFKNPDFWRYWKVTIFFTALVLLFNFSIPIIQALFLSETTKGKQFFSTIYLIPTVIPLTVTVVLWKWIFNPYNYGWANYLLTVFGIAPQTWYSDPNLAIYCMVIPGMIGGGFGVLLYLSAIHGISADVSEAAQIDGCNGFQRLRYIILPNIGFLIMIQLIMTVIGVMQIFDPIFQYTRGGPAFATTSVTYAIYSFFRESNRIDYGKATATAFMLLVVIAVITAVQMKLDRSERD